MKDMILLYNDCCIYEIVILNYFLKYTNSQMEFCSVGEDVVQSVEGYSINIASSLENIDITQVRSFIVPGGNIKNIDNDLVLKTIETLCQQGVLIAGICAGVDVLDKAGILKGIRSTHSTEEDCVKDGNVITARANAYVDFAIEVAKALDLFEDEEDLQETIDFWKFFKRVQ